MKGVALSVLAICLAALPSREATAQPGDEPVIFLGELQSVTLTKPERRASPLPDGSILISNSCGEETAVFRVIRSTAPVEQIQTLRFTIGEWCHAPVEFPHDHWLIVVGSAPDREAIPYAVFSEDAAFALVADEAAYRRLPQTLQQRLPLESLPSPEEYPYAVDLNDADDRRYIARQSTLEIRDEKVWVVRGVLLTRLFPEFSPDELR
jgi:hypothetical protein